MNKKAISPIIATILLLVLTIVSSTLLFTWYQGTQVDLQDGLNKKINTGQIKLLEIDTGILYIRNFGTENINIKSLEIDNVNCDISFFELTSGLNEIDIFSCVNEIETGYKKIFIKTKDEIVKDTLFIEKFIYINNPLTGFCDLNIRNLGNGSSSRPYLICDRNSLSNIGDGTTSYFLIVDDIDLEGSSSNPWDPITNFYGNFDGGGNVISNLYVNTGEQNGGLFGKTERGSSIKNIGVKTLYIKSNKNSGGLVGLSFSTISNSYVINIDSSISGLYSGGFVGDSFNNISNSYVINTDSSISGSLYSGGLAGQFSTISNSYVINTDSTIYSSNNAGGLVGRSSSSISNSSVSWLGTSNLISGLPGYTGILKGYGNTLTNSKYYKQSPIDGDPSEVNQGDKFSSKPKFNSNDGQTSFIYDTWDFINTWEFNTNDYPTLR